MPRRIKERDCLLSAARLDRHAEGANMLGNATRLAFRYSSAPKRVKQRRLAVIDVSHDSNNWRSRWKGAHVGWHRLGEDVECSLLVQNCGLAVLADEQTGKFKR